MFPPFEIEKDGIYVVADNFGSQFETRVLETRIDHGIFRGTQFKVLFRYGDSSEFNEIWKFQNDFIFKGTMEEWRLARDEMIARENARRLPLLRFPYLVSSRVLKSMHVKEVYALSLTSKRCYNFIKSLKLKTPFIQISADSEPVIHSAALRCRFDESRFSDVMEWLSHFMGLFHKPSVELRLSAKIENVSDYRHAIENLHQITFDEHLNFPFYRKVLKEFSEVQIISLLHDYREPLFGTRTGETKFLIANTNTIVLDGDFKLLTCLLRKENILASISRCVKIWRRSFTVQQLNNFLKSWVEGRVFPILRTVEIVTLYGSYKLRAALRNIDYQMILETKTFETVEGEIVWRGGVRIVANNGTTASLKLNGRPGGFIGFYIWD